MSVRLAYVQPVLPHLLVERRPVNIELVGGRLAVPGVALEGGLDDEPFGAFERERERHRLVGDQAVERADHRRHRRGAEGLERFGEVVDVDLRATAQYDRALYRVFQFAYVAGPRVA